MGNSEVIHLAEKRAISGSAVFLTDIFQLERRLGFVPYFRVTGSSIVHRLLTLSSIVFLRTRRRQRRRGRSRVRLEGLARIFGKFLANSFSRVNATGGRIRDTRINTGDLWWAWVDLNHRPRPYQGAIYDAISVLSQESPSSPP